MNGNGNRIADDGQPFFSEDGSPIFREEPTHGKFKTLTGQVSQRLTVLGFIGRLSGALQYACRCSCGGITRASACRLASKAATSCGCYAREKATTHGLSKHPLYVIYKDMLHRCYNKNSKNYPYYGGRGIGVCKAWRDDPAQFFESMGKRPAGWTLERKDNNKGYSPGNVEWASREDQMRNRNYNVLNVEIVKAMRQAVFDGMTKKEARMAHAPEVIARTAEYALEGRSWASVGFPPYKDENEVDEW